MGTVASWDCYDPADFSEKEYGLIPAGKYRVRIEKAEEKKSQAGNLMIELTLSVSGYNSKLWYYIVLDGSSEEKKKETNQKLGTVFNSFNIPDNTMDLSVWEGKVGGVKVRHSEGNDGEKRAEVHYLLYANEVAKLPPWQEGSTGSQGVINPEMATFSSTGEYLDPEHIPF